MRSVLPDTLVLGKTSPGLALVLFNAVRDWAICDQLTRDHSRVAIATKT